MDKIICVGKNYLEHAQELGDAVPESPILFLKPPSCLSPVAPPSPTQTKPPCFALPQDRGMVHYECEIVLQLNAAGQPEAVTLGLDLTLRDVQAQLKKQGHPWELGKVFAHAAITGPWIPIKTFEDYLEVPFQLKSNQEIKQKACGKDMRFSPAVCLKHAARHFPILAGDLLFTGTPPGVGPIHPGDVLTLEWADRLSYSVTFR
jgi:2-keto-4-pentenoate hydratase/2-oxohepta-3-ene-1,7-dioic acid hydratase in catechol pathway